MSSTIKQQEQKNEKFLSFSITNILNESEQEERLVVNDNDDDDNDDYTHTNDMSELDVSYTEENESNEIEDDLEETCEDYNKINDKNEANLNENRSFMNKDYFINLCHKIGLSDSNLMNQIDNKNLFKFLFNQSQYNFPQTTYSTSQLTDSPPTATTTTTTTTSFYNTFLSNWLTNLNNLQETDLFKANLIKSNEKILDTNVKPPSLLQKRMGHPYQNRNPPKRKKPRTSFNRPQIVELEKRFMKQKYLASSERSSLAKILKMTDAQVKTWFQNRRTKWRRQNAEEMETERQAANKLLMSLKQQQQQQQNNCDMSALVHPIQIQSNIDMNMSMKNNSLNVIAALAAAATATSTAASMPSPTTSLLSSSNNCAKSSRSNSVDGNNSINNIDINPNSNPLNRLIMMEMALNKSVEKLD